MDGLLVVVECGVCPVAVVGVVAWLSLCNEEQKLSQNMVQKRVRINYLFKLQEVCDDSVIHMCITTSAKPVLEPYPYLCPKLPPSVIA